MNSWVLDPVQYEPADRPSVVTKDRRAWRLRDGLGHSAPEFGHRHRRAVLSAVLFGALSISACGGTPNGSGVPSSVVGTEPATTRTVVESTVATSLTSTPPTTPIDSTSTSSSMPSATDPPGSELLAKEGDVGDSVSEVQSSLLAIGYGVGASGIDGEFGRATKVAVMTFQLDYGLPITGQVDVATMRAIDDVVFGMTECRRCDPSTSTVFADMQEPEFGAPACDWLRYGYELSLRSDGALSTPELVRDYMQRVSRVLVSITLNLPSELEQVWPTVLKQQEIVHRTLAENGYVLGSTDVSAQVELELGPGVEDAAHDVVNQYQVEACGLPLDLTD